MYAGVLFLPTSRAILCKTHNPDSAMATNDSPLSVAPSRSLALALELGGGFSSEGVSGDFLAGSTITISPLSGETFGPGPNNEFYLGSNGKAAGNDLVDGDQQKGTISQVDVTAPEWVYGGLYSSPALDINNPAKRIRISYTPTTEIFVSALVRIGAAIDSFGASYKMFWLADGADGFGGHGDGTDKYDLVMLTKQSSLINRMAFAGNESGGTVLETQNGAVPASQWFHFSGWIKDNGLSEMGALCQIAKPGASMFRKTAPDTPGKLMLDASISTSISRINIMGDSNANNGGDVVPTYIDQLYISTGDNARARVEIGDAEVYDDCGELYPVTISSWSSTIVGECWHPSPSGKYLHIHKGDGDHINSGVGRAIL